MSLTLVTGVTMKHNNNSNGEFRLFSEQLNHIRDSIRDHEKEIETHIEHIRKLRLQQRRYEKCNRLLSENDDDNKPAATRSRSASTNDPKRMALPALLEMIGQQQNKGIRYKDMAVLVKNSGYRSHSKNFSNMVYQALEKLVNKGRFQKDRETLEYTYAG